MYRPAGMSDSDDSEFGEFSKPREMDTDSKGWEEKIPDTEQCGVRKEGGQVAHNVISGVEEDGNVVDTWIPRVRKDDVYDIWIPLHTMPEEGPSIVELAVGRDLTLAIKQSNIDSVLQCLNTIDVNIILPGTGGPSPAMLAAKLAIPTVLQVILSSGGVCRYRETMAGASQGLLAVAGREREEGRWQEEIECCKLLVEEGKESVDMVARQGLTPLMLAAREGKMELVAWMCDVGAKVNRKEGQGWTALMFSVDTGHGDVARLLLERGADPSLVSRDGQRAADIAVMQGNTVLQEVLDMFGAEKGLGAVGEGRRGSEVQVKSVQVDNILLGLGLGEYLDKFRSEGVQLEEFLLLGEEDLERLGVTKIGARKRLLTAQAQIHKKDWERGSLPQLQLDSKKKGLMISCVDATGMMANISQHARFIKSNIGFIELQLRDHGDKLLEVGGDLVSPKQFYNQTSAAVTNLQQLQKEAVNLERELRLYPSIQGNVDRSRKSSCSNIVIVSVGVGIVLFAVLQRKYLFM